MPQEPNIPASNTTSTKPETQTSQSSPQGERPESFSDKVYYGVPFDELLEIDFASMSLKDQAAYLAGIRSARVNPGHKKVEKSTGSRTKGKGSEGGKMLEGLI
jgi:hypothetical protein